MGMKNIEVSSGTYAKDLGIGTNLGGRRITRFVAQRILKAKGRVKRIAILSKANRRAARLFNTGAWPQASYGKEAVGMAPCTLESVRALAAASVNGGGSGGKCPTTLIW